MEETREDAGQPERRPSNMSWWPSDFVDKFESVSLSAQDETLRNISKLKVALQPQIIETHTFAAPTASSWRPRNLHKPNNKV